METKRLNSILASALVATAVLAIIMPVYYLSESGRQEAAAERFDEIAVERGHEWYEEFQCGDCHGPVRRRRRRRLRGGPQRTHHLVGGTVHQRRATTATPKKRSATGWCTAGRAVRCRPGAPRAVARSTTQQIDELLAYLEHIAASPDRGGRPGRLRRSSSELARLDGADASAANLIERQHAEIAALDRRPGPTGGDRRRSRPSGSPADRQRHLHGRSRRPCSNSRCDDPGADGDGDGLADAAEVGLAGLIAEVVEIAPAGDPVLVLEPIALRPAERLHHQQRRHPDPRSRPGRDRHHRVQHDRPEPEPRRRQRRRADDQRRGTASPSSRRRRQPAAGPSTSPTLAECVRRGHRVPPQRAAGLFNAYCARCHTAGYSAGVAFTKEAGSGGFGPSLRGGRSLVQFPDFEDQVDFIIKGSENGKQYGVNGVGRGWMPGFGTMLSEADLD